MKNLPQSYDHATREKFWQEHWVNAGTYHFKNDKEDRQDTYVIDTPPPTVSGVLHMGHIFSYTQADFIARYKRMSGKDVFYPMGFDDNGLPTERLVEKTLNIKGSALPREEFIEKCRVVVKDAEDEFRKLFKSTALSVDWRQEYQTISDDVRKLSQASFLDLIKKGEAYRSFRPTYWDWVDQTAIASAEIEEKEQPGIQIEIPFGIMPRKEWEAGHRPTFAEMKKVNVMTTRPELLGSCVALMCNPAYGDEYSGMVAISPLFNIQVPVCVDAKVDNAKGTGFVMCCSWGDDTDKEWINSHGLPWRPLIHTNGRLQATYEEGSIHFHAERDGAYGDKAPITKDNCLNVEKAYEYYLKLNGSKLIRDIKNENSAKGKSIKMLEEANLLQPQGDKKELVIQKLQMVKCAERSGTPIEIIPTYQWFIRIVNKKEQLLAKGEECTWHPEYMRIRLNQWIEGLKEDWCISRQRFFGIPFPVWYSKRPGEEGKILIAEYNQLPVDPLRNLPAGYDSSEVTPDMDVMDTWATSSISPQINARAISSSSCGPRSGSTGSHAAGDPAQSQSDSQDDRYQKLFPADLRPQAHEIIRTWAFYTIVKAHLHENTIPWKNIMISGWCLAADKSKMSKSKGNVITPVALIEDKGSDAVRYWASTSRLATDTAFSEDLLKIGRKLVTKLWNASNFASQNLTKLQGKPTTAIADVKAGIISEPLDMWILSRLNQAIKKSTEEFERYEYCDARVAIEDFFWNDFCDNYLELVKARAYGVPPGTPSIDPNAPIVSTGPISGQLLKAQQSALHTIYHCLDALLRLFAPFVPHITEELYSNLFEDRYAATGSVHARGNWPKAADYPYDAAAERAGIACVDVLNSIRRAKSEASVSIKYPVAELRVHATGSEASYADLAKVAEDLKGAGNVFSITNAAEAQTTPTDKGWFTVHVMLVKQDEKTLDQNKTTGHKRNADQKDHERLEGKVLHAPGNPDLSKQVVKLKVAEVPQTLEQQKGR